MSVVRSRRILLVLPLVLLAAGSVGAVPRSYELEAETEAPLLTAGLGLYSFAYLVHRGPQPLTAAEVAALEVTDLNALDRSATDNWSVGAAKASDILMYTSAIAPVSLMLSAPGRDQADIIGIMYLETALLNSGLTYLLKNVFGRTRPFVYNDDPDIPLELKLSPTAKRSFPSGHTSTAFASLVFLATVQTRLHPDSSANGWMWGGCLTAAATTGYLRYRAGMHFPTDIIAGATLGAFAGWVVPQLHEWDPAPDDAGQKSRTTGQSVIGFSLAF